MVTKCMEAGRIKCDQYWPSDMEPIFYGDLQVTIINEDTSCSMWTVREIQIPMVRAKLYLFNPLERSGVRWLHIEVFSAIQV